MGISLVTEHSREHPRAVGGLISQGLEGAYILVELSGEMRRGLGEPLRRDWPRTLLIVPSKGKQILAVGNHRDAQQD